MDQEPRSGVGEVQQQVPAGEGLERHALAQGLEDAAWLEVLGQVKG